MTAKRYTFEFISSYDGRAEYRLYIDGRANTRFCVNIAKRACTYIDASPVLFSELAAFNSIKKAEHAAALAKHGPDFVPAEFVPYVRG